MQISKRHPNPKNIKNLGCKLVPWDPDENLKNTIYPLGIRWTKTKTFHAKVEPPMGIILNFRGHLGLWRILQTFFRERQEDCTPP